ncbi:MULTISPECIES: hypothetical protein [unclassified Nonomuraea]|uniref:hypothetical protein n=1 Tax=unclassified Nonomuraea TaxID=2593643 RepID=UPI0033EC1806
MEISLTAIMDGLEARLATISGLRVSDVVPDQINPPHAFVGVPPITDYHASFRMGTSRLEVPIWVFVSAALDRVGQRLLADYASPSGTTSIRAAVEAPDPDGRKTLGGVPGVQDVVVRDFRPLGREDVGAIGYLGGQWTALIAIDGR